MECRDNHFLLFSVYYLKDKVIWIEKNCTFENRYNVLLNETLSHTDNFCVFDIDKVVDYNEFISENPLLKNIIRSWNKEIESENELNKVEGILSSMKSIKSDFFKKYIKEIEENKTSYYEKLYKIEKEKKDKDYEKAVAEFKFKNFGISS